MFGSLRSQGDLLRHVLPFYVSSWWRRGDLSWVMYLNAFVLLLVAATSLFGQLPGAAGQVAQKFGRPVEEVRSEFRASLVPGILLQPSGVYAVLRAQDVGCAFLKST
jgi:hypothetical protein